MTNGGRPLSLGVSDCEGETWSGSAPIPCEGGERGLTGTKSDEGTVVKHMRSTRGEGRTKARLRNVEEMGAAINTADTGAIEGGNAAREPLPEVRANLNPGASKDESKGNLPKSKEKVIFDATISHGKTAQDAAQKDVEEVRVEVIRGGRTKGNQKVLYHRSKKLRMTET